MILWFFHWFFLLSIYIFIYIYIFKYIFGFSFISIVYIYCSNIDHLGLAIPHFSSARPKTISQDVSRQSTAPIYAIGRIPLFSMTWRKDELHKKRVSKYWMGFQLLLCWGFHNYFLNNCCDIISLESQCLKNGWKCSDYLKQDYFAVMFAVESHGF